MEFPKALIIDDEEDTCLLLGSILKQKSIRTTVAHSIADAKYALTTEVPDIVFLDNRLKDGLGLDFIPAILHDHPKLKIVLMTAYDTPGDRDKAMQNGAVGFIGKPFTRTIIADALRRVF
ncbi:MAG TPA: response regulator [Panacibacter sp.]|nr:response regulator [Panacibacter sp.]HNP46461.1 response regulator [Panacibacter sp.]